MPDLYTLTIDDGAGGADFTFGVNPAIEQSDLERVYRDDVIPSVLGSLRREWILTCAIDDDEPADVVTSLDSFLNAHINVRVQPKFFKLKDSVGADLPDSIGVLSSETNLWEEIHITDYELVDTRDKPNQLRSGAEFILTVSARKVFPDANGIWFRQQEREESANDAGLIRRERRTEIKISEAAWDNGAGITIASLLSTAGMVEPKPIGFRRIAPANNSDGASIRFPRYPIETHAFVISVIEQVGELGAVDADGTIVETVTEDPILGIDRITTEINAFGNDALSNVITNIPTGGLGFTREDRQKNEAKGAFETRRPRRFIAGKATGVEVRFRLTGGHRLVDSDETSGGFLPQPRTGPFEPWRLEEEVKVWALGVRELNEIKLPPLVPGAWGLTQGPQSDMPRPEIRGGSLDNHVWSRVTRRNYIWTGEANPLADAEFAAVLIDHYLEGRAGARGLSVEAG